MRATTPRVVTRRTLQERPSQLRPEETPECRRERRDRAVLAWRQWQEAIDSASALEVRRRVLEEQLRTADVPAVSDLQQELAAAREELARYDSLHRDLGGVNAEIRTLEGQLVAEQASPVIQEASGHLNLLTLGRYCALRVSEAGTRLQVIAENGCPYVASALSRGTLFQVALSLRVALVDEYARRGLEFPLVLDDVLVDSDEHRLEAAAELLSAAARRGRQVLFLTCQDHLVTLLEDRGAVVHELPGSERVRRDRPVFIPRDMPAAPAATELIVEKSIVAETSAITLPPITPPAVALDEPASSGRSASEIRSLPSETAAALAAAGIVTLSDILRLDLETAASVLPERGPLRRDLHVWQAEASLLERIDGLHPEDARLLAAVGITGAEDLAQYTAASLWQRIQRFRGSTPQPWHAWMRDRFSWPREEEVALWIQRAHGQEADVVAFVPVARAEETTPDDDGPQPAGEQETATRRRTRRSRRGRPSAASSSRGNTGARALAAREPRYFLTLDSPILDAPAIGPKTARMLNRAGVQTVSQLLQRAPAELASTVSDRAITPDVVTAWQQQSRLMCELPELRGHDAQLLVACGFTSLEAITGCTASQMDQLLRPFAMSKTGQRLLRSAPAPERQEIEGWIRHAEVRSSRRAA
jgi:predicted flap endonuclease-1-like 5' DNA nuclease